MRRHLPIIATLAFLLSACAGSPKTTAVQALTVTKCVVSDDRLGLVVEDPSVAIQYLDHDEAENAEIRSQVKASIERLKAGPPDSLTAEVETMQRAIALLEDLEDLALRLRGCIDTGKQASAK